MDTRQLQRGRVKANGAELYYETRGEGPPLLLVAGGLADAGQFTALGDALAGQHRVVTYDRRGNSRSPAPAGWTTTTVEEQADDAAALLEAWRSRPPRCTGTASARRSHSALPCVAPRSSTR
jgi:pimeloyl-ACP methyl ester carboxylesterase